MRPHYPHQHGLLLVSIHAPTRGATIKLSPCQHATLFQSTHPHGVRRMISVAVVGVGTVSIHAPTRGATQILNNAFNTSRFQSTHPHGVRQRPERNKGTTDKFQSTHPHGVRRLQPAVRERLKSFNPRTHTGCDITAASTALAHKFQSTHPHGVRQRGATFPQML